MSVENPVPDMTYNVFGGTLNLALSIYLSISREPLKMVIGDDFRRCSRSRFQAYEYAQNARQP